jgi:CheY-like chemotaxis protein
LDRPDLLIVDDDAVLADAVSSRFEAAGWAPRVLTRGRAALESIPTRPPAAAVVSVLLPDMMGQPVAEALRARGVPFALVAGVLRGARAASEARSRLGALAYVEKPVGAAGLEELMRALPLPARSAAAAQEVQVDVGDGPEGEEVVLSLTTEPAARAPDPAPGPALTVPEPPPPELPASGPLGDLLPRLILAAWRSGRSGRLLVQRGSVRKEIHLEDGRRAFARSSARGDRFSEILVRAGKVRRDEIHALGDEAQASGRRLGDLLVERGILDEEERVHYLGQQVKAIIYSLFAWEEGEYRRELDGPPSTEAVQVDLDPANLIARGVRKLYRPERLLRLVAPNQVLAPVEHPTFPRSALHVQAWESELLDRVDGRRTVVDLRAAARRPAPEVNAILHVATVLGILAPVRR